MGKQSMIDKMLQELILKYDLDMYYPRYRKKLQALKIIQELASCWMNKKVLCICVSDLCKRHFEKAVCDNDVAIDYFVIDDADCYISNVAVFDDQKVDYSQYDEIWNISYRGSFFINNFFYN